MAVLIFCSSVQHSSLISYRRSSLISQICSTSTLVVLSKALDITVGKTQDQMVLLMENQSLQLVHTALQLRIDVVSSIFSSFLKEVGWLKGKLAQGESGRPLVLISENLVEVNQAN